jgi:EAL domain-containing protein (putative c-di-GMP-specific phosphodiesterase class I)
MALERMARGERVRHLLLHALTPTGAKVPISLSGYINPQNPATRLLVLTHAASLFPDEVDRDRSLRSGLLERNDFERLASRMLNESSGSDAEQAYRLTLLEIPELDRMGSSLGSEAMDSFMGELGDYLRSCSVGGDSAGQLADNRYGVIHSSDLNALAIQNAVTDLAKSFTQGDKVVDTRSSTMVLDSDSISGEEAVSALVYTLNRFSREGQLNIQTLAEGMSPRLTETVDQMREVRRVIEEGEFDLAFQPVVDLWTHSVHHFEVLLRFRKSNDSPYAMVTFAEDTGLVGQLDQAICRRAIEFMRSPAGSVRGLRFAVNLSGRSLSDPATAQSIMEIIRGAWDLRRRLLFEVTESAEIMDLPGVNNVIQEIRAAGHPVCMDDFGAGSAAFHYLRALKVDHVKIDGSYVRDCVKTGESMPFLRAITQLCRELKVGTIAEFVEDEETAALLRVLKVRLGQGYYFGKPFKEPANSFRDPHRMWVTGGMVWRNGLLFFNPGDAPQKTPAPPTTAAD